MERLEADYPGVLRVQWSPFLLDPTIPPEGRTREPRTSPGDPPSPLEVRGQRAGITFTRGRTFYPNSRLSMELAHWAQEIGAQEIGGQANGGQENDLHRRLFKAHHTDNEDLANIETLVRIAGEAGLPEDEARDVLDSGRYTQDVEQRLQWAHQVGVQAVPTFIVNEQYGLVGAQEYPVFQRMMEQLGHPPPAGAEPPPDDLRIGFEDGEGPADTGI